MSGLPGGFVARAPLVSEIDVLVDVANVCELVDTGEVMWERADLWSEVRVHGFDDERDWVGVWSDDRLMGWALVSQLRRGWVFVDPSARGAGIGSWLRHWTERRAEEKGSSRIGQTIDDAMIDVAAALERAGYTRRHTSWIIRKHHPDPPGPPSVPEGVALRPWTAAVTSEALEMFEEAFAEWPDRQPTPIETWASMTIDREGFSPDDLMLAVEHGRVVGGVYLLDADEMWVDKLAVARHARGRGIGKALMELAFERSFDRGYRHTSVSTDSRTGALGWYEGMGMLPVRSFTHFALDLDV